MKRAFEVQTYVKNSLNKAGSTCTNSEDPFHLSRALQIWNVPSNQRTLFAGRKHKPLYPKMRCGLSLARFSGASRRTLPKAADGHRRNGGSTAQHIEGSQRLGLTRSLGARKLLGAKGIATNGARKLLGAPGLTTRSKDATAFAVLDAHSFRWKGPVLSPRYVNSDLTWEQRPDLEECDPPGTAQTIFWHALS